ncbi:hypothetical protein BU23DRAFT_231726 [Bimuria novae-zelandiae CBS 107.79]|uniref:Uncharacterized protein n=1 Tax=Bimuria novae-zelandiae CBS 107.79 TaxID=1447943 RepID=A0A6A5V1G7_9PLEO|nr:hypothetical protein BU23DRAFT_231726 [Bimuria novae-zelandiae CBS 107.79]
MLASVRLQRVSRSACIHPYAWHAPQHQWSRRIRSTPQRHFWGFGWSNDRNLPAGRPETPKDGEIAQTQDLVQSSLQEILDETDSREGPAAQEAPGLVDETNEAGSDQEFEHRRSRYKPMHLPVCMPPRANMQLLVTLSIKDVIQSLSAGNVQMLDPDAVLTTIASADTSAGDRLRARLIFTYLLCRSSALLLLEKYPHSSLSSIATTLQCLFWHRRDIRTPEEPGFYHRQSIVQLTTFLERGLMREPQVLAELLSGTTYEFKRVMNYEVQKRPALMYLVNPSMRLHCSPALSSKTTLIRVIDFSEVLESFYSGACDELHLDSVFAGWMHGAGHWSHVQCYVHSIVLTYLLYRSIGQAASQSKLVLSHTFQGEVPPIVYAHMAHPAYGTRPFQVITQLRFLWEGHCFQNHEAFAKCVWDILEATDPQAPGCTPEPNVDMRDVKLMLPSPANWTFSSLSELVCELEEENSQMRDTKELQRAITRLSLEASRGAHLDWHPEVSDPHLEQKLKKSDIVIGFLRNEMSKGFNPQSLAEVRKRVRERRKEPVQAYKLALGQDTNRKSVANQQDSTREIGGNQPPHIARANTAVDASTVSDPSTDTQLPAPCEHEVKQDATYSSQFEDILLHEVNQDAACAIEMEDMSLRPAASDRNRPARFVPESQRQNGHGLQGVDQDFEELDSDVQAFERSKASKPVKKGPTKGAIKLLSSWFGERPQAKLKDTLAYLALCKANAKAEHTNLMARLGGMRARLKVSAPSQLAAFEQSVYQSKVNIGDLCSAFRIIEQTIVDGSVRGKDTWPKLQKVLSMQATAVDGTLKTYNRKQLDVGFEPETVGELTSETSQDPATVTSDKDEPPSSPPLRLHYRLQYMIFRWVLDEFKHAIFHYHRSSDLPSFRKIMEVYGWNCPEAMDLLEFFRTIYSPALPRELAREVDSNWRADLVAFYQPHQKATQSLRNVRNFYSHYNQNTPAITIISWLEDLRGLASALGRPHISDQLSSFATVMENFEDQFTARIEKTQSVASEKCRILAAQQETFQLRVSKQRKEIMERYKQALEELHDATETAQKRYSAAREHILRRQAAERDKVAKQLSKPLVQSMFDLETHRLKRVRRELQFWTHSVDKDLAVPPSRREVDPSTQHNASATGLAQEQFDDAASLTQSSHAEVLEVMAKYMNQSSIPAPDSGSVSTHSRVAAFRDAAALRVRELNPRKRKSLRPKYREDDYPKRTADPVSTRFDATRWRVRRHHANSALSPRLEPSSRADDQPQPFASTSATKLRWNIGYPEIVPKRENKEQSTFRRPSTMKGLYETENRGILHKLRITR